MGPSTVSIWEPVQFLHGNRYEKNKDRKLHNFTKFLDLILLNKFVFSFFLIDKIFPLPSAPRAGSSHGAERAVRGAGRGLGYL